MLSIQLIATVVSLLHLLTSARFPWHSLKVGGQIVTYLIPLCLVFVSPSMFLLLVDGT